MPQSQTPRELLLAALNRRRLTGYRASRELAWVVFPPQCDGGASLQVIHVPRKHCYRVTTVDTSTTTTVPATRLGDFRQSDDAVACLEDALRRHAGEQ